MKNTVSPAEFAAAPSRLTISLGALVDNWRVMDRLSGKARASAVVKADAYGLGIAPVGAALYAAGCRDFFVAQPQEGAALRKVARDARIYVLSGAWPGSEQLFFDFGLVPVLASEEQLAFWMALVADGNDHPCALQVDSGMNRLGLTVDEAISLVDDPSRPSGFSPVLVMSHLACGDEPGHAMNRRQLESFQQVAHAYEGIALSLCNSASILMGPDYHFDLTRPGIALYGGMNAVSPNLQTVVTAEARILQVREAKAGETVSYGATYRLTRDSRLAVVACGYCDGWHRALSGTGVALRQTRIAGAYGALAGKRVPLIGRVTMDLSIFDVTDLPAGSVQAGQFIELFGKTVDIGIVARAAGTIEYELLTSLGSRYLRNYTQP